MAKERLRKIYIIFLTIYVVVFTSFYFIAGDQLWYAKSEENATMPVADAITGEIHINNSVSQDIKCPVDRLDYLDFIFTKNYHVGSGELIIEVSSNNKVLATFRRSVKDVPDQEKVTVYLEEMAENMLDKSLHIEIRSNSKIGEGVHALMDSSVTDAKISEAKNTIVGSLCYAVGGYNKIWITQYYWVIVSIFGALIAGCLFVSYKKYTKGKQDYIVIIINAIDKYRFLISQLVARDFKTKYKRSIFGVFWSFLNPLLTMIVQFLVFSTIFRVDTQNYPVYLISGVVCFSFFNECTTMCLNSISGNYRLITKVYIPKYIFPLAKTISSSVNLGISLIPLLLVTIVTGTKLHLSLILAIYFLICLIIFSLGIGMILATLMVFFRDIQFLWSVFCTIWQYATPIFYPAEIIPEKYRFIVRFNPLYHFIGNVRKCLIDGISPEPKSYLYCFIFAFGALAIGSYIFKKSQDKFTLYL